MKNKLFFLLFFSFWFNVQAQNPRVKICLSRLVAAIAAFVAAGYYDKYMGQQIAHPTTFKSTDVLTYWEILKGCLHVAGGPFHPLGIPLTFLYETWGGLFSEREKYYALRFCAYYAAFGITYHTWRFCTTKNNDTTQDAPPPYQP